MRPFCRLHSSVEDFLQSGDLDRTGCVVLDLRMPGMSGLDLLVHLAAIGNFVRSLASPAPPVPALVSPPDPRGPHPPQCHPDPTKVG